MKDFCKWLGVNEKIAKVVVWVFIFMISLIIINTALESFGVSYYKLTIQNISKINYGIVIEYALEAISALLGFYAIIFLIFPLKEFEKIFPWSMLYLFLMGIVGLLFNYLASQIYILSFVFIFSYFYSKKNLRYILYAFGSLFINTVVQYLCYLYKVRFIDATTIAGTNVLILSMDYIIIMFLIISIKEKIFEKRRKENG